ncbi:hypothetical protein K7X08_015547 [Anisodus acutangulus]|uniref:Uncharacterized protein n=1 Tax=Anisodus acutangulus TaxID=402998 RepID=A0A9Q1L3L0_9SOLA|nr:hypothetical protein K7X08_015547 [Anisodus acutangulus]
MAMSLSLCMQSIGKWRFSLIPASNAKSQKKKGVSGLGVQAFVKVNPYLNTGVVSVGGDTDGKVCRFHVAFKDLDDELDWVDGNWIRPHEKMKWQFIDIHKYKKENPAYIGPPVEENVASRGQPSPKSVLKLWGLFGLSLKIPSHAGKVVNGKARPGHLPAYQIASA